MKVSKKKKVENKKVKRKSPAKPTKVAKKQKKAVKGRKKTDMSRAKKSRSKLPAVFAKLKKTDLQIPVFGFCACGPFTGPITIPAGPFTPACPTLTYTCGPVVTC